VEVLKSFEPLLGDTVFIGFEKSKAQLPATCVLACEADCKWVNDMLALYDGIKFVNEDGSYNMTTNVQRMGERMMEGGLVPDGKEQYLKEWGARVYPFDVFSPLTSTRVLRVSENTYSIHHFASSWHDAPTLKGKVMGFICDKVLGRELADRLIKVKRRLLK